jgi:hypothetical protein
MIGLVERLKAKDLAHAVPADSECDVDGLVFDHPTVRIADFDPQGIEDGNRIHAIQRPGLPFADLAPHRVGDAADLLPGRIVRSNACERGRP